MKRCFVQLCVLFVLCGLFAACGSDNASGPQSVTYSGVSGGVSYTLKITEGAGRYAAQAGDSYTLTVGTKISSGKVQAIMGASITLAPANAQAVTFSVTVSGTSLATLAGTITWESGDTEDLNITSFESGGTNNSGGGSSDGSGDDSTHQMVLIQPGTFTMGSPESPEEPGRGSNETQHEVTLSAGFYMAKYQVTQDLYTSVMGSNPSYFTGVPVDGDTTDRSTPQGETQGKRPVERVSWYDALVFCNKLSAQEGLSPVYKINNSTNPTVWGAVPTATWNSGTSQYDYEGDHAAWDAVTKVSGANGYRLPTEAAWEYACRAGKGTAFNCGTSTYTATGDYDAIVIPLGWYTGNSDNKTHEVGKKAANDWGLYDMHGNVYEWCGDRYAAGYYSASGAGTDPMGPTSGVYGVRRGGCEYVDSLDLRSACRGFSWYPWERDAIGIRLVRGAQ
jgi:formylglycine-generating enzyme required for sulfatase activity